MNFKIGCHVSIAKGVWNAPKNAYDLGCETFQIFTRSPQGGPANSIDDLVIERFKIEMQKYKFTDFVVHCPYYINFGSGKPKTYHSSISIVREELERASLLSASFVMFHTGSGKDLGTTKSIKQAKDGLKKVLDGYAGSSQLLIEIAAGAGEILGDTFEEVAELMEPIKKHKGFGGVCFDTQHAWASGYDLSKTDWIKEFDKIIGSKWLKMSHINDSKVELGAHKDRHEHIGDGKIGKAGFERFLFSLHATCYMLPDFPLILETEHDKVKTDIEILKKIRNKILGKEKYV